MVTYLPQVRRDLGIGPRGNSRRALASCAPTKSAISQWGWGFHTVRSSIDPEDLRFRPRVVGVVQVLKDLLSGDGSLFSSGCPGSMYDPPRISDRRVGLGLPHRAGRFRPGGSPCSSPGCRSCKGMEIVIIRGWEPVLPGVRWLYVRFQPISDRWVRLGFPHRATRG